jgi:hypothetical protein
MVQRIMAVRLMNPDLSAGKLLEGLETCVLAAVNAAMHRHTAD